jgi:hypothetical protein
MARYPYSKRAYRKKAELLLKYYPDLAVVPECEYLGEETKKRIMVWR